MNFSKKAKLTTVSKTDQKKMQNSNNQNQE